MLAFKSPGQGKLKNRISYTHCQKVIMAYLMYARENINNQITTVLVISYHFTCRPQCQISTLCVDCVSNTR